LNKCDLVLPRDHLSLKTVERLGISSEKVHLVPDVAVNQPYVSSDRARRLLVSEGVDLGRQPVVGMAISEWKELDTEEYFGVMQEICEFISIDLQGTVVLFSPNMPFWDEASDWELAQALYESLPDKTNVVLLSRTYTPREFKGMQGELNLFVSTRMHAAILATMIGTPTITVNTQPKLLGYMSLIGQEDKACGIEEFTIEWAKTLIQDTLKNNDQIREALREAGDEVRKKATVASKLLKEVYEQRGRQG
jgi:polysaccharide pyruvyl transferase WcaK-like protein